MTEEEEYFLKDRCGCAKNETSTWFHDCREEGYKSVESLGYAWQAEFRAYHLWTEKVLKLSAFFLPKRDIYIYIYIYIIRPTPKGNKVH